ncbi:MAG: hypothetical protein R3E12_05530 [Candidatus Eisenbacteria bacterium]
MSVLSNATWDGASGIAILGEAERAMLDYALRLTVDPAGIDRDAIDRLRAVGFDDRAIHDICAVTAYFAFVNRIADGLGVELEDPASS